MSSISCPPSDDCVDIVASHMLNKDENEARSISKLTNFVTRVVKRTWPVTSREINRHFEEW